MERMPSLKRYKLNIVLQRLYLMNAPKALREKTACKINALSSMFRDVWQVLMACVILLAVNSGVETFSEAMHKTDKFVVFSGSVHACVLLGSFCPSCMSQPQNFGQTLHFFWAGRPTASLSFSVARGGSRVA